MSEEKIEQAELKKRIGPLAYNVTQTCGTEVPFSGKYVNHHEKGMYRCIVCGTELFSSDTKFDSGTGWPSFSEPAHREHVELIPDHSLGMERTEVRCKQCGAHLGHVFPDGPKDAGGDRFCINSAALDFEKR